MSTTSRSVRAAPRQAVERWRSRGRVDASSSNWVGGRPGDRRLPSSSATGPQPVMHVRPADLLVLTFSFSNRAVRRAPAPAAAPAGDPRRHFIVEFPSQHVVEKAYRDQAAGIAVKAPPPPAGDNDPITNQRSRTSARAASSRPAADPRAPRWAVPARLQGHRRGDRLHPRRAARRLLVAAAERRPATARPRRRRVAVSVGDLISSKGVNVKAAVAARRRTLLAAPPASMASARSPPSRAA